MAEITCEEAWLPWVKDTLLPVLRSRGVHFERLLIDETKRPYPEVILVRSGMFVALGYSGQRIETFVDHLHVALSCRTADPVPVL